MSNPKLQTKPGAHLCHARGCHEAVPPKFLMCSRHWKMVPSTLQALVWKHYRRGQEIDKRPSLEYLAVMQTAITEVAKAEAVVAVQKAAAQSHVQEQGTF